MKTCNRRPHGFTLVELIVVIGIIGVLASMLMGGIFIVKARVKVTETKNLIRGVELAAKVFESEWGYFPADHPTETNPSIGNSSPLGVRRFYSNANDSQGNSNSQKEDANIILTHLLLTTKKNGPYLEPKQDNLFRVNSPTLTGNEGDGGRGDFLRQYLSQFTTQSGSAPNRNYTGTAYYLVDSWGHPLVYDRNSPEGTFIPQLNSQSMNYNIRSFDIYSWGENEEDQNGQTTGAANDDINNWE